MKSVDKGDGQTSAAYLPQVKSYLHPDYLASLTSIIAASLLHELHFRLYGRGQLKDAYPTPSIDFDGAESTATKTDLESVLASIAVAMQQIAPQLEKEAMTKTITEVAILLLKDLTKVVNAPGVVRVGITGSRPKMVSTYEGSVGSSLRLFKITG